MPCISMSPATHINGDKNVNLQRVQNYLNFFFPEWPYDETIPCKSH